MLADEWSAVTRKCTVRGPTRMVSSEGLTCGAMTAMQGRPPLRGQCTGHQCWRRVTLGTWSPSLRGGGWRPPGGGYKIRRLSRGSLNQRVRSSLAGAVVIVRVKSGCNSVRKDFFTDGFSEFCFKPSTCLNTAQVLLRGDHK